MQRFILFYTFILFFLATCSPYPAPSKLPSSTPSSTPLPPPQAIDLGILGKGTARDVAWLPDGKILAVLGTRAVDLYDVEDWQVLGTISREKLGGDGGIASIVFSPDGQNLIITSANYFKYSFWKYDMQTGQLAHWLENIVVEPQTPLVFTPDGKKFAFLNRICGYQGDTNPTWTCSAFLEVRTSNTADLLYSLQKDGPNKDYPLSVFIISPNGKQLAMAREDNFIDVWDITTGKLLYELQHDSNVADVIYSPDGKTLASASKDGTVRFWDAETGANLFILHGFKSGLQKVAYITGNKRLLVGQLYDNLFREYALNEHLLPGNSVDVLINPGAEHSKYFDADITTTILAKISPDTQKMATLVNNTVQIWDLDTGKSIKTLPGYNGQVSTLAFSPDGNRLAIADENIHLWDVHSRTWIATFPANAYKIGEIAFRPKSNQIAAIDNGVVQFWNTDSHEKIREDREEQEWCDSSQLAFSPDGERFATAGWCGIWIRESDTGRILQKFDMQRQSPRKLAFSADGKELLYVADNLLARWNLDKHQTIYSIDLPGEYHHWSASIGLQLMILGDGLDGPFLFFDPQTGRHLYDFAKGRGGKATALHPDERLFARADYKKLLLAEAASGQPLLSIDFESPYFILFSPDRRILAAGSYDGNVHLWDISSVAQRAAAAPPVTATPDLALTPTATVTPEPIAPLTIQPAAIPTMPSNSIRPENVARLEKLGEYGLGYAREAAWSADGKTLAVGGSPGVYIFRAGAKNPSLFLPSENSIFRLAFSPDGRLLAGQLVNDSVQIWDISSRSSLYTLKNIGCWNQGLLFSQDSRELFAYCGGATYHWSMATGQLIDQSNEDRHSALSPTGHLAMELGMSDARLVNADTLEVIKTFDMPDMAPDIARFSPDGKTLLLWFYQYEVARTGIYFPGKDHKSLVQVWNIDPGKSPTLRTTLPTGKYYQDVIIQAEFRALLFSPDSRRVFTASGDGQVQIWDAASGDLLATLPDGNRIFLSPSGNQLLTIGRKVQVWDVAPGKQPLATSAIPGFSDYKSLLTLIDNDHSLVTASDGEYRFWPLDKATLTERPSLVLAPDVKTSFQAISPDGKWFAYSTATDIMLGENNPSNPNWRSLERFSDKPFVLGTEAVIFSPDSSMLAVNDADRKILLWRLDKPEAGPLELGRELFVSDLIFSPDSKMLLGVPGDSAEEQSLYLWDATTGHLLRTWGTRIFRAAFDPSGMALTVSNYSSGELSIFDLSTWKLLHKMDGEKYTREIAFSPDGSLLAASGESGIEFWDVADGKLLRTIAGSFRQLIFSSDGKLLIASLNDGRIQIWGLP